VIERPEEIFVIYEPIQLQHPIQQALELGIGRLALPRPFLIPLSKYLAITSAGFDRRDLNPVEKASVSV